jgi:diguanylate cyclase (GGDEF)-like protein/PAS domain S-box-containing protein
MSFFEDHSLSWQSLLEALPDGTALIDGHGTMLFVNDLLTSLTGYTRDELTGENVQMLVPPQHKNMEFAARDQHARNPNTRIIWSDQDLTVLRKDGSELSVDFALSPLTIEGKRWSVASIRDNSEHRAAIQARTEAERNFRLAFEDNMAPMLLTDLDDEIIAANAAFCAMIGRTNDELVGFDSKPFTFPEDIGITEDSHQRILRGELSQVRYIKRYQHRDGRTIVAEISKSPARDEAGNTLYFIISERDITEERTLTAQLSHQALHDPLTGLANRALFEDRLAQAMSRIERLGGYCALLLLDLDDFKGINDTHGHLVGDHLLAEVAHRLEGVTRAADTLCRFGGDEFLYLAEGISGPGEADELAARLMSSLEAPFTIGDLTFTQQASLGVVVWDATSDEEIDVVRDADVALYEAKRLGKGRHIRFEPGMHQQTANRYSLAQQLRHALTNDEISMHFQPIVDLASTTTVGFEALMRWRLSERGWVPPNVFIPLAEQSDLILDLGSYALTEAIALAGSWSVPAGTTAPYITVNISARQFHDPGLIELIERRLDENGVAPERLVIEITEGVALLEITDTLSMIEALRDLGVGVALDDFGTGFSSLSYLSRLNPMIVKIDQSFVRAANDSERGSRLLETVVSLGHNLGMTVLAVGIETTEQLERLRGLDCPLGQGFLFSPAVPHDEASLMLGRNFCQ